ncbi:choice-of-anchor Q domain-containing protein [Verrucomicrobium spinosum]|uniref:choice-of-anchor Q domain-containing protein n=1 Tax=Verrucomicrobium spinosum TaxID=2736 RepID=UPI00210DEEA5|nr:choice-of-anchor Q domain-containing protein [Verrucomicrobium spinosum]
MTRNGTLKANSPAINAAAVLYTSGKDAHGEPRPTATAPDIGLMNGWIPMRTTCLMCGSSRGLAGCRMMVQLMVTQTA